MSSDLSDLKKDYEEFVLSSAKPPQNLNEKIFEIVRRDLNPSALFIFGKLFLIHLIFGSISLFACPQFGLTPTGSMGIMGLLMPYGNTICAMGCGSFFVFGTVTAAALILRPEELKVLRRTEVFQFLGLSVLSITAFFLLGADAALGWIVLWLLGSWIFGSLVTEVSWNLRRRLT